ncbi:Alpha-1_3-fucosyltransferase, partial [Caligus rogercresseyi]
LSKQYKFYLAFENSVCKDYITEKFYDVMQYDVVPVVYGLANYSALAPPHSFIDIRDFKSPKALGEYLTYLDKNDEEYLKYFKWRVNYRVRDLRVSVNKVLRDMCDRLNHVDQIKRSVYSSEEMERPTIKPGSLLYNVFAIQGTWRLQRLGPTDQSPLSAQDNEDIITNRFDSLLVKLQLNLILAIFLQSLSAVSFIETCAIVQFNSAIYENASNCLRALER